MKNRKPKKPEPKEEYDEDDALYRWVMKRAFVLIAVIVIVLAITAGTFRNRGRAARRGNRPQADSHSAWRVE